MPIYGICSIITNSTMMIEPYADLVYRTMITESNGNIKYSTQSAMELIKEACITYVHSTYQGRRDAIQTSFNFKQNVPIPINHKEYICAIPTKSPSSLDCIWLFYNHIYKVEFSINHKKAKIHFYNGTTVLVVISYHQMLQQLWKAGHLLSQMNMQDSPKFKETKNTLYLLNNQLLPD
ncbi:competence protein [Bacillus cereus]|nr:competence protein [Bacillus cereus]PGU67549.1 competence protein [Bacillus cereus]